MSIRSRLIIIILSLVTIPMVFVSVITFSNYKSSLTASRLSQLQSMARFKAEKIETYFAGLKNNIEMSQGFYNVRKNLTVLARSRNDPNNREADTARKMLDGQLERMRKVLDLSDIMLADKSGTIVYVGNPEHASLDLFRFLGEISPETFTQGAGGVYFSDIFINKIRGNRPEMLATALISGLDNTPAGTIVFEIDMAPLYRLIADTIGLGATGEVLIGKKSGNDIVYLNPLRHDKNPVLTRHIPVGDKIALPIQNGVAGKTGFGLSVDYRGINVVAAWRHVTFPDWGLVAKIDAREEFAVVTNLQRLLLIVLAVVFVMAGIITFSVAQSISGPIQKLTKGAGIIGSGNLNHKVGMDLKDEIGQLSRSFDKMTNDIKAITASRDDLNAEIAERRRAEEALRESELRLRAVAETTPVGIGVVDLSEAKFLYVNQAYEKSFGYERMELIGRATPEIYWDIEDRKKILGILEEQGYVAEYEVRFKRRDGSFFWGLSSIRPITFDGRPALLGAFVDITERKKAEIELERYKTDLERLVTERTAALRASEEQLLKANEMKILGQLTSGVAHEVRNPLNGIIAIMGALSKELSDTDRFQPYVQHMRNQVTRLTVLMEDLLMLGRPLQKEKMVDIPFVKFIQDVVATWQQAQQVKRDIRLNLRPSGDDDRLTIRIEAAKMEQMVVNLLDNAHQHTPAGKDIEISIRESDGGTILFSVRDNGPGIPADVMPRVFEPFFTTRKGGTGLGLSIVRHIVESHGGSISAFNNEGRAGTTFEVRLPLAKPRDVVLLQVLRSAG